MSSNLKRYSMGRVVSNKQQGSTLIYACPIEEVPYLDGDLEAGADGAVTEEYETFDTNGQISSGSVESICCVEAEWLCLESGRSTAPDVRAGEEVIIWKFSGISDKYWWTSTGRTDNLRRLETVIHRYSDVPEDAVDVVLDDSNSYSIAVSTHTGQITIRTAQSNEEPYRYTWQLNARDGVVTITDNAKEQGEESDNVIQMDSAEHSITIQNANSSNLVMARETISMYAHDWINLEAGNSVEIRAGKEISLITKATLLKSDDSVKVETKDLKMLTSTYLIQGAGTLDGKVDVTGPITGGASATFAGAMTAPTSHTVADMAKYASVAGTDGD